MDNSLEIKKRIHDFIDHADARILRIIHAIITSEETENETLTVEHKDILNQRLEDHKINPTSGKSWNEVKQELQKNE